MSAERKLPFRTMPLDELRSILDYDPISGNLYWRVTASSHAKKGSIAGALSGDGYRYVTWKKFRYRAHRMAWALYMREWPTDEIDHINGDKLDNRIKNLRVVTAQQNQMNRGPTSRNTTGFKGVTWDSRLKKFSASIRANGKRQHLGYFNEAMRAGAAYLEAARQFHGEFFYEPTQGAASHG